MSSDITSLETRAERWRQALQVALGLSSIWLGHEIATWASDPAATSVRRWTAAVVVFGLVRVGRAVSRFTTSVSTRQERVFRCRQLVACEACVFAAMVTLTSLLLIRGPFRNLFSHGTVTSEDIADLGFVFAAGFCLLGAIVAFVAAAAEYRAEHSWRRPRIPTQV